MKLGFIICILTTLPIISYGQKEVAQKVDSLKYVVEMPYICRDALYTKNEMSLGCGDAAFWDVVKLKEKAIPFLLDKLEDSLVTPANVPNFGWNYTVGDIVYEALSEIIHGIPTFELLGVEFYKEGCGGCSYWQHLNENYQNRVNFKKAVVNWYKLNKENLVWVESNAFTSCDCSATHPNKGHYKLQK